MPATRTQIYLTEDQRRRIDALAANGGVTMAEIIRRAVESYLSREMPDPDAALETTFGAAPGAVTPERDDWDRG